MPRASRILHLPLLSHRFPVTKWSNLHRCGLFQVNCFGSDMPVYRTCKHNTYECNRQLVETMYKNVVEPKNSSDEEVEEVERTQSPIGVDEKDKEVNKRSNTIYEADKNRVFLKMSSDEILESYGISNRNRRETNNLDLESKHDDIERFLRKNRRNYMHSFSVPVVGMHTGLDIKVPQKMEERIQRVSDEMSLSRRVDQLMEQLDTHSKITKKKFTEPSQDVLQESPTSRSNWLNFAEDGSDLNEDSLQDVLQTAANIRAECLLLLGSEQEHNYPPGDDELIN